MKPDLKSTTTTPSSKASLPNLPFHVPSLSAAEIEETVDTLQSGWWTSGPKTKRFEEQFAEFVGVEHAVAVNSATAGLHLALEATGVGPGDKVITSTYTFTATAEVVRYLGADVILVDVDPGTLNISVDAVRAALESDPDVKAIVPVHFAGHACEMDELIELAQQFEVRIIEDAAHALPTDYRQRRVGSIGDATAFSFYVTKTLATGEGGMVTTNDAQLAERFRLMRLHGISRDAFRRDLDDTPSWYYEVVAPGYKYNMTDLAASLGLHQLKRSEEFRQARFAIAQQYDEAFGGLPVQLPQDAPSGDMHAWHLYVLRLSDRAMSRDAFVKEMTARGIGTSVHFIPLHIHPYWRDKYQFRPNDFPVAHDSYQRAVSLPIYPAMKEDDVLRVCRTVVEILDQS